jgi:hypothetical protein
MRELPTFASSSYASNSMTAKDWQRHLNGPGDVPFGDVQQAQQAFGQIKVHRKPVDAKAEYVEKYIGEQKMTRRMVQVFIVDMNDNVPLDKCLLYKGDPVLTDLTDQELFFEIDIRGILEKYNIERVKFNDKTVKDRNVYLEPAKVRDLRMTVVNIASF